MKASTLVLWMTIAIAAVTALAYWDERREAQAALDEFGEEQAILALGLSRALDERLAALERDVPAEDLPIMDVLSSIRPLERPGAVRVLVRAPGREGLLSADGGLVRIPTIEAAFHAGARKVQLSRMEASELGLPERIAMVGLAPIDAGALGRWGVAVVTTAQDKRDREQRAQWRLLLGVVVASGLVLAFGGVALRKQRKELELSHALAMAAAQRARDERLVRADKLATMGALATGIAHEVSTPLGVILGRAEQILARADSDERLKRAAETITEQTERIHAVIRGFLALARGKHPALEHTAPEALARTALDLVEHRFAKAEVNLRAQIDEDLPPIACEPRLFEQVLVNLLLNACDACGVGGTVELSVRGDSERVTFAVSDDGAGISAEVAARATEPFFTTKPEGKGTGLGLAIANEIVKHHRGSLTLSPGPNGRGTLAVVELAAAAPETVRHARA